MICSQSNTSIELAQSLQILADGCLSLSWHHGQVSSLIFYLVDTLISACLNVPDMLAYSLPVVTAALLTHDPSLLPTLHFSRIPALSHGRAQSQAVLLAYGAALVIVGEPLLLLGLACQAVHSSWLPHICHAICNAHWKADHASSR